jgi:DNA polymerase III subunit delta'
MAERKLPKSVLMWQTVGHDHAIRLLQNSIETKRTSHAYLFSGPRQIGKATLARDFARALNCAEPDRPCGRCRSCRKIDASIHPDVQIIELEEGSKNISIDAVRKLQEGVALRPFEGMVKVYIIEEVERLSEPAANSLLKTLEEPPPSVVMVLTTLDANSLLPTVVSRCQQMELHPVPTAAIEGALRESHGVDPERARLLATLARGRMGWAVQAASSRNALDKRTELMEKLLALPRASRVGRFAYAAELATLYGRDPESARGALEMWQSWWRDLLLSRLGLAELVVNADLKDRVGREAGGYSVEALGRMVRSIHQTTTLLGQNVNPRLALEALMLNVPKSKVANL